MGNLNKYKRNYNVRKQKEVKQVDEGHTDATLPIYENFVLVCEGRGKVRKELGALFTSTSPRHPVIPHQLVLCIIEVVEPTISLEIVTHVF